jgi:hypothetical protein
MINFSYESSDMERYQHWTVTICGVHFINGQQILFETEQLRQSAKQCTMEELNHFIKECEEEQEFEKCAILFEEIQSRIKTKHENKP